jgi:ABC-type multidrug transport system fused ATPase/permease subunit
MESFVYLWRDVMGRPRTLVSGTNRRTDAISPGSDPHAITERQGARTRRTHLGPPRIFSLGRRTSPPKKVGAPSYGHPNGSRQTGTLAAGMFTVLGAREHNLKDVNVDIPRDSLVVFTGVSGSGKSSLAFGTLYAEAQRR